MYFSFIGFLFGKYGFIGGIDIMNTKAMKRDKGFTLVELIVVLVILAILAAIIVPALLGYIDKAREKQDIIEAKACITAAQAVLSEEYGKTKGKIELDDKNPVINVIKERQAANLNPKEPTKDNGDVDLTGTSYAKRILQLADLDPYCFMFAVGSNHKSNGNASYATEHDKYTVYYGFYMATADSEPVYYYNGEWTKANPRYKDSSDIFTNRNVVQVGPLKGKRLQYYLVANKTGKGSVDAGNFWNWLKAMH